MRTSVGPIYICNKICNIEFVFKKKKTELVKIINVYRETNVTVNIKLNMY